MSHNFGIGDKVKASTDVSGLITDLRDDTFGSVAKVRTAGGFESWYPTSELRKLSLHEARGDK